MKTRRSMIAIAVLSAIFATTVHAADTIKIGWLPSLSGPLAATPTVMDKGVNQAVKDINAKGGINGRQIELVTRDTAGDPTKAVNVVKQVIFQENVALVIGPLNSGEALASVPVIAQAKKINLVMGALQELIDIQKYPNAFRMFPTNQQFFESGTKYAIEKLGAKRIAVVSDTTGYGAFSAKQVEEVLVKMGRPAVVTLLIDPNKTDLSEEISKLKASGADVVMPWGASTSMFARVINGTRDTGWNVPIVGAAALSAAPILKLLNKPSYWNDVYAVGFASAVRSPAGAMQPVTKVLYDGVRQRDGVPDYTFWWYSIGYDMVRVAAAAIEKAGGTDTDKLKQALESTKGMPGAFATYSWSATDHDGFPLVEVVPMRASTFKDGLFDAADAKP